MDRKREQREQRHPEQAPAGPADHRGQHQGLGQQPRRHEIFGDSEDIAGAVVPRQRHQQQQTGECLPLAEQPSGQQPCAGEEGELSGERQQLRGMLQANGVDQQRIERREQRVAILRTESEVDVLRPQVRVQVPQALHGIEDGIVAEACVQVHHHPGGNDGEHPRGALQHAQRRAGSDRRRVGRRLSHGRGVHKALEPQLGICLHAGTPAE